MMTLPFFCAFFPEVKKLNQGSGLRVTNFGIV